MTRKEIRTDVNKKRMIEAMTKSFGIVATAIKMADISRAQHYRWMEVDSEYKAQIEAVKDIALDFAESALMKQIQDGNTAAILFFLKTQGKRRGYIERNEIDLGESRTIKVIMDGE
jgi:hypothetical protein